MTLSKILLIKTHLSQCSKWMAGVTLGDMWRPLEGHFIFPLNRWKSPPLGMQRLDSHNDRRSSSWHSPIPQFHNQRMCQGDGMLHAKAPSHASDSYARWDGEGVGEKAWALREAAACLSLYRRQLSKKQYHNRLEYTNQQWSREQLPLWK